MTPLFGDYLSFVLQVTYFSGTKQRKQRKEIVLKFSVMHILPSNRYLFIHIIQRLIIYDLIKLNVMKYRNQKESTLVSSIPPEWLQLRLHRYVQSYVCSDCQAYICALRFYLQAPILASNSLLAVVCLPIYIYKGRNIKCEASRYKLDDVQLLEKMSIEI